MLGSGNVVYVRTCRQISATEPYVTRESDAQLQNLIEVFDPSGSSRGMGFHDVDDSLGIMGSRP